MIVVGTKGINTTRASGPVCYHEPRNGRNGGVLPKDYKIPYGRGGGMGTIATMLFNLTPVVIVLMIIVITITVVHREVLKNEKKMQRYGSRSLHLSIRPGNVQHVHIRLSNSVRSSIFNLRKPLRFVSNRFLFDLKPPPRIDLSFSNTQNETLI